MSRFLELDLRSVRSALCKRDFLPSRDILGDAAEVFGAREHGYYRIDDLTTLHLMDFEARHTYNLSMARRDMISVQIIIVGSYYRSAGDFTETVCPAMLQISNCPLSIADSQEGSRLRGLFIAFDRQHFLDLFKPDVEQLPEPYRPIFLSAGGMAKSLKLPLKAPVMVAVEQILSCKYSGPLKAMFLNAKVMEIMCAVVSQLNGAAFQTRARSAAKGLPRHAIEAAAGIYQREIHRPPTIDQLAFRLGINRNELTQGFREIFGTTPHAYFHALRMDRARQLLQRPELTVSDIARQVGYEGYTSFARAYSDYFGCAPTAGRGQPGRPEN